MGKSHSYRVIGKQVIGKQHRTSTNRTDIGVPKFAMEQIVIAVFVGGAIVVTSVAALIIWAVK